MIRITCEAEIKTMCVECGREIEAVDNKRCGRLDIKPCLCQRMKIEELEERIMNMEEEKNNKPAAKHNFQEMGDEIDRLRAREKELEKIVFELTDENKQLAEDANKAEQEAEAWLYEQKEEY